MSNKNEKKCPTCPITSHSHDEIERDFGFRNMKDPNGNITSRPQSYCRNCRTNHSKNQLKLKHGTIANKQNHHLPRELNSLDIENFTKDWNSGMSLIDLAKKYDFSYPEKAKRIAKQLDLPFENRPKAKRLSDVDIDIENFTKDWTSGMSFVGLSIKYNLDYAEKARRIAKQLDLPFENRPKAKRLSDVDIDIENFTKDWTSGMSFVDLSIKYNLDYAEKAKRIGIKLGLEKQKNLGLFERFLADSKKTNEFISMYGDDSIKIREITKHFDFADNGYASKIAKQLGIPIRAGGKGNIEKFEESKKEFTKMWNNDVFTKIIMKTFDISKITVHSWRIKLGLTPRGTGRMFYDTIAQKIELLLLENSGALTSKELKNLLNKDTLNLTDAYKSMKFQRLPLTLHTTGRGVRQPTDYFGDNTGQTIIFLNGMYDSLILKLSKILREGNMFKNNLLKRSVYNFLISRLAENNNKIKNRETQLFQILFNKEKQNELESFVKIQLNKYSIKQKPTKTISEIKSNDPLIDQIIENMPKSVFFGRIFQHEMILNELSSSYPDRQNEIIQEIFAPFNFISKCLDDNYFNLEIISNVSFFVKLMINQQITETTIKIFHNKLQGKKGIIVNFESVPESILKNKSDNITILNKSDMSSLLSSVGFLPIIPNSFAKIMFGENKGEIVFCTAINFETNIATVMDSDNKIEHILIKFLKNIPLPEDITTLDFFNFIKKFKMISSFENISTMDECNVHVESFEDKYKFVSISSQVDSNFTKISIPHTPFHEHIEDDDYITSVGFLRNVLIKCNCLSWISQDEIILCKHSVALLFHLWKQDIEKINKNFERKTIEIFLEHVNFLINYSIEIEKFWYQKIDNVKTNHSLIHQTICNLIDDEIFKTTSFYHEYDVPEKLELENLMSEYKNEKLELFESMKKLSFDQRKIIQESLNHQFQEKQQELHKLSS